jgi:hypothetical protein
LCSWSDEEHGDDDLWSREEELLLLLLLLLLFPRQWFEIIPDLAFGTSSCPIR